jgi:hypothetical protein
MEAAAAPPGIHGPHAHGAWPAMDEARWVPSVNGLTHRTGRRIGPGRAPRITQRSPLPTLFFSSAAEFVLHPVGYFHSHFYRSTRSSSSSRHAVG